MSEGKHKFRKLNYHILTFSLGFAWCTYRKFSPQIIFLMFDVDVQHKDVYEKVQSYKIIKKLR